MLVLSRKRQESVVVGGSDGFAHVLKVTVVEIKGGTVRLGFEIDVGVPVHRAEVWERIHATRQPLSPPDYLTVDTTAPGA
jgi:carbon storage regulator CsrA